MDPQNSNRSKNIFVEGAISSTFIAQSIDQHSKKTEIGAHSLFLGQVRADWVEGKKVTGIHYTTYLEMSLQKMNGIREAIFEKYSLTCMHIYHSLGLVQAGEICLLVFTSSAHRKVAIDACEELVEKIKNELPIWGQEIVEDHERFWKINK
jgi:molybdopterin synthase catalytic subunit